MTARNIETVQVDAATAIEVLHVSGVSAGPTVALLGGVHGDEPEGALAVHRVLRELDRLEFSGKVMAVPVASPAAFESRTRTSPVDGGNLARAFPGDAAGSPTARVAHVLTTHVLCASDILVDLHSAGRDYRMPPFVGAVVDGTAQGAASARVAAAFQAPIIWLHETMNPGRSISAAWELEMPAVYAETGGGGGVEARSLDAYVAGVLGVMEHMGMLRRPPRGFEEGRPTVLYGGNGNVDAGPESPIDGWCIPMAGPGEFIPTGGRIAELLSVAGVHHSWVTAPTPVTLMMIRHTASIRRGDLVAMLGPAPGHSPLTDEALPVGRSN